MIKKSGFDTGLRRADFQLLFSGIGRVRDA
jgi:hypothetical protein